jgi:hypothetical protein
VQALIENRNDTTIETDVANKDVAKCKKLYLDYVKSFGEKPNTTFVSFLFDSLESRRISITQELIDSIRYISRESGL